MNKQPDAIHYTEAGAAAVGAGLEREVLLRELARAMQVIEAAGRHIISRSHEKEQSLVDLDEALARWERGE